MTLPTIVIAGAPKCGTTSLHRWLADHPGVCSASVKETRYLLDHDSPMLPSDNFHTHGLRGYERLFAKCDDAGHVLESTPDYLYSATAATVLASIRPQPRVIFVLRRPGARAYSFYNYARNSMALLPAEISFRAFLTMLRDPENHDLDDLGTLSMTLRYGDYARYLEQWLNLFPEDRLFLLLFETMVTDNLQSMIQLARWAGLDPSFYEDYAFPVENDRYDVRSQRLQRIRMRLAPLIPIRPVKLAMRRVYEVAATSRPSPISVEDKELISALEREYEPANERLQALTGLDLSAWRI